MNRQETLSKIKETLKTLMKFSDDITNEDMKKKEKFNNFDLTDGTKITSDDTKLDVGSTVYAMDDNNNQTPLEDGEYVLTDGTTITVKSGTVSEIADSDTEESEDEEMKKEDDKEDNDKEEDMKKVKMTEDGLPMEQPKEGEDKKDSPDVQSQISDLQAQIESILNILNKLGTAQNEVNEEMMSKIESFSKENGGQAIKLGKKEFNGFGTPKESLRDSLKEFRSLVKSGAKR